MFASLQPPAPRSDTRQPHLHTQPSTQSPPPCPTIITSSPPYLSVAGPDGLRASAQLARLQALAQAAARGHGDRRGGARPGWAEGSWTQRARQGWAEAAAGAGDIPSPQCAAANAHRTRLPQPDSPNPPPRCAHRPKPRSDAPLLRRRLPTPHSAPPPPHPLARTHCLPVYRRCDPPPRPPGPPRKTRRCCARCTPTAPPTGSSSVTSSLLWRRSGSDRRDRATRGGSNLPPTRIHTRFTPYAHTLRHRQLWAHLGCGLEPRTPKGSIGAIVPRWVRSLPSLTPVTPDHTTMRTRCTPHPLTAPPTRGGASRMWTPAPRPNRLVQRGRVTNGATRTSFPALLHDPIHTSLPHLSPRPHRSPLPPGARKRCCRATRASARPAPRCRTRR